MAPRPSQAPDPQRQLMIKTKTCQRLIKEASYYKDEVVENEQKLQQMIDEGKDPYDIKKFREVLGESHMMVPDSEKRLEHAIADLSNFLAENEDITDGEWYETATKLLEEHTNVTPIDGQDNAGATVKTNVEDLAEGEVF